MNVFRMIALSGLAAMIASRPAPVAADVVNGGFESGLSGWSAVGDVTTVVASFGSTPPEGTRAALLTTASIDGDAHNFSNNNAVAASVLRTTLGLAADALPGAVEGSALYQTITAAAGDLLSFRYNFLTVEGSKVDYAFLNLAGLSTLATVADATVASGVVLDPVFQIATRESGWKTFTYTFLSSGTFTLGIGVVDVDDEFEASGLLVDAVTLQNGQPVIPEPSSALMLGIAGAALALTARRRT